MFIELQSLMKVHFRMCKPIAVSLTTAISILCVQQKAIADDHFRIDKEFTTTAEGLCVENSQKSVYKWNTGFKECLSDINIVSNSEITAYSITRNSKDKMLDEDNRELDGTRTFDCTNPWHIDISLCDYLYRQGLITVPAKIRTPTKIASKQDVILDTTDELPYDDMVELADEKNKLMALSDRGSYDNGTAKDTYYANKYSESIAEDSHNKCLQASDYKGCMEYQEGSSTRITETGSEPGTVDVAEPKPYNYDPESVMQLKIRGSYGRYLTFIGKTVNEYAGTSGYMTPGSPGSVRCTTSPGFGAYSSSYTTCSRSGYVAPTYIPGTPGGVQNRKYRYELDCQDMTFDRKGDYAGGMSNKGWMSVDNDPTAQAVANRYCSSIESLPRAAER